MNSEQPIKLGSSDLQISPLGVGTNSWGANRKAGGKLKPVFDTALEMGINFFDTAEVYGLGGSERILGKFLETATPKPVVTTKFFPFPWRLSKSSLLSALKASLERLKLNQVDLYLIHWPFPPVGIETWMEAMAEAVESGMTRAVGVSNYNVEQVARAHVALAKHGIPLACNQFEYNLLKRDAERAGMLVLCRELGVTPVAYRPLARGLLSNENSPENPPQGWRGRGYRNPSPATISPIRYLLRQIGEAHEGKTPAQVALNWLICKGAVPIPGATSLAHLRENAGALGWRLEPEEVDALDRASAP